MSDDLVKLRDMLRLRLKEDRQALRIVEGRLAAMSGELLSLKMAAYALDISKGAALKRAQRGAGIKIDDRWFFNPDYVEPRRRHSA